MRRVLRACVALAALAVTVALARAAWLEPLGGLWVWLAFVVGGLMGWSAARGRPAVELPTEPRRDLAELDEFSCCTPARRERRRDSGPSWQRAADVAYARRDV